MANVKAYAKMMPHSIEAEQAVLGCSLIDENVPIDVMASLNAGDFYVEAHKQIFDAMKSIYSANVAIDFVTLTDQLEKTNLLESVGGIDYITTLTNIIPSEDQKRADPVSRKELQSEDQGQSETLCRPRLHG